MGGGGVGVGWGWGVRAGILGGGGGGGGGGSVQEFFKGGTFDLLNFRGG